MLVVGQVTHWKRGNKRSAITVDIRPKGRRLVTVTADAHPTRGSSMAGGECGIVQIKRRLVLLQLGLE